MTSSNIHTRSGNKDLFLGGILNFHGKDCFIDVLRKGSLGCAPVIRILLIEENGDDHKKPR